MSDRTIVSHRAGMTCSQAKNVLATCELRGTGRTERQLRQCVELAQAGEVVVFVPVNAHQLSDIRRRLIGLGGTQRGPSIVVFGSGSVRLVTARDHDDLNDARRGRKHLFVDHAWRPVRHYREMEQSGSSSDS